MKKNRSAQPSSNIDEGKYLRLLAQIELRRMFSKEDGSMKIAEASRFLHAVGFSPTEIANLLGKKKATEISQFIYSKKRK